MTHPLFSKMPTETILLKVIECFDLVSFQDTRYFSCQDIEDNGTCERLFKLKPELKEFYHTCKGRLYLNDLVPKSAITLLRQLLRTIEINVVAHEKYSEGTKTRYYQLVPKGTYNPPILLREKINITINFD